MVVWVPAKCLTWLNCYNSYIREVRELILPIFDRGVDGKVYAKCEGAEWFICKTWIYYDPRLSLHTCKVKEEYSSLCYKHLTATGTHVPYGITLCYLPLGRGDIPAFTPANYSWYSIYRP